MIFYFSVNGGSSDCLHLLQTFFKVCERFGIPLAREKTEWPSVCVQFLGITIDSRLMEFRLPADKVSKLEHSLLMLIRRTKVTLKEMQSLLGLLAFASRVIPLGKLFARKLYSAITGLKSPSAHVRLSAEVKEDMLVWIQFLIHFNGRSVWQEEFILDKDFFTFYRFSGLGGFRRHMAQPLVC